MPVFTNETRTTIDGYIMQVTEHAAEPSFNYYRGWVGSYGTSITAVPTPRTSS
jgi:hypothetical protein